MKKKKNKKLIEKQRPFPGLFLSKLNSTLPQETRKWILGVFIFVISAIIALSFFDLAGVAGKAVITSLTFLIGKAVFIIPLILAISGLIFFKTSYQKYLGPTISAILVLVIGISRAFGKFGIRQTIGRLVGIRHQLAAFKVFRNFSQRDYFRQRHFDWLIDFLVPFKGT